MVSRANPLAVRVRGRDRGRFLRFVAASRWNNENKISVIIRINGYAFSRATPRKSGACGAAGFFREQASRQTSTMNFGLNTRKYSLDTCVPEGRSENRRALQRRLLTICNRPRPGGPGILSYSRMPALKAPAYFQSASPRREQPSSDRD